MNKEKNIILFGAGIVGRTVLQYFDNDEVYCFADNFKYGQVFLEKKIISFDELREIHKDYRVIVTVQYPHSKALLEQCAQYNIPVTAYYDEFYPEKFKSKPEISSLKDMHKGKRCFVIGNGPSLLASDLDVLHNHNEICFASNYITQIYKQTNWRPDYYMIVDGDMLTDDLANIKKAEAKLIFLPELEQRYDGDMNEAHYVINRVEESGTPVIKLLIALASAINSSTCFFSNDVSRMVYISHTVTFTQLQLAVYMGFSEIYLLGVDNTGKNPHVFKDDFIPVTHFYLENDEQIKIIQKSRTRVSMEYDVAFSSENQYKLVEKYSQNKSFQVFNATRGGRLEVFKRVSFDALFKDEVIQ